jgi:hypothetical protein
MNGTFYTHNVVRVGNSTYRQKDGTLAIGLDVGMARKSYASDEEFTDVTNMCFFVTRGKEEELAIADTFEAIAQTIRELNGQTSDLPAL